MTEKALVIDLAGFIAALRERETLVRLLTPYDWFFEARLEVKPTGQSVIVAITDPPSDAAARAGTMARVASHLNGVVVEDRPRNVGRARPASLAHEPESLPREGSDSKTE